MIGSTLAHYRIDTKLGEGGMGVVYRARDTRLDRTVAIKVLPHQVVADPQRKRRFVQEAKAASALNHPNIVTIYDIDSDADIDFIVMEFVPGQTLGQRIGGKPLPVKEAIRCAVQIADALAAAHEAGIIHRDLKPGNIMLTDKGVVKVLDFGLAKLTERVGEQDATMTETPQTADGAVVGTAPYMSPEQAEGKKVDARSDVFSFGAVLYEMVTGKRAFRGDSRLSTLAAILREEPQPVAELAADVPRDMEKLLARCLRKDPERRAKDMRDLKLLLEEMRDEWSSESSAASLPAQKARPPRRFLALAGGGLALAAVVAGGAWWLGSKGESRSGNGPVLTRLVSDAGLNMDPALSPDGKFLAYASDAGGNGSLDIWVRQVAGGEPLRLTDHEADDYQPAFSPDGSQVAFRSDRDGGGIYLVSALGGQARRIARQGHAPRFSPAGDQIAYSVGASTQGPLSIFVVPSAGGTPTQLRPDFYRAMDPVWSRDGKRLLFRGTQDRTRPQEYEWWVTPLEGGEAVRCNAAAVFRKAELLVPAPAVWLTGPDRILFSTGSGDTTNLWETPISPSSFQLTGAPRRVTFGTGQETSPSSSDGSRVVFADMVMNSDLWALPLDANKGKVTGEPQRLTTDPMPESYPFVSADGRRVGFTKTPKPRQLDAWLKELPGGKETPLAASPAYEQYGCISADGSRIAYETHPGNDPAIFAVSAAGGDPQKLCEKCRVPTGWSWDNKKLVFELTGNRALVMVDVASGQMTEILKHSKYGVSRGRFSADGRWLSFHAIVGPADRRVFVAPLREGAPIEEKDWIAITDGQGMERYADWSPDGNWLYFLSERDGFRCIRGQKLDPATKRPAGEPFDVYHFHHARRSLFAAGDPITVSPTVARDKMVFSMVETTGAIWMAQLDRR